MSAGDAPSDSHPENSDVDPVRLSAWMQKALGLSEAESDLSLVRFRGGHSNRTYGVTSPTGRWVLRLPPVGTVAKGAHDVSRECRVLQAVAPAFPLAPRVVATEDDPGVLGAPFYLMEHLEGTIIRKDFPADLKPNEDARRGYAHAFIEAVAQLHQTPTESPELQAIGSPVGYTERQLAGWNKRFEDSATRSLPKATQAFLWLAEHLPREDADCVIHNDLKFDNVVYEGTSTRLVGVLDWELATRGHPLMDLGTVLAAWVEASDPVPVQLMRLGPTNLSGMPTRAELVTRYGELSGRDVSAWRAFYVFGLVKLGVVAQQLYARFVKGEARDPRFAALEYAIPALFEFCEKQIQLAETA